MQSEIKQDQNIITKQEENIEEENKKNEKISHFSSSDSQSKWSIRPMAWASN